LPPDLEQRFAALMKAEGAALARLAASYARGSDDRDDLFQEIAVAIWQALPRFRGECSERTFVFRIAHNRGLAYVTRRRPPTIESGEELELRDRRPDPEQSLSVEQERQRLLDVILKLPVGYRQVVTLALEGMSYAEIGDVLGITESNAGARLTRARQMLRTWLKGTSHGT
jgi:RNA polymerase sigma-70 factor (ECF subfamily)